MIVLIDLDVLWVVLHFQWNEVSGQGHDLTTCRQKGRSMHIQGLSLSFI